MNYQRNKLELNKRIYITNKYIIKNNMKIKRKVILYLQFLYL